MKDFIYIEQLSPDLRDILSKKQAFSMKSLNDGFWGLSPDYLEFLDGVNLAFDSEQNILIFYYKDKYITYDVTFNSNYAFKIKYLKNSNKLFTSDFNKLYSILIDKKVNTTIEKYVTDSIFQSVFKKMNGIKFDSLYVADKDYIESLLNN